MNHSGIYQLLASAEYEKNDEESRSIKRLLHNSNLLNLMAPSVYPFIIPIMLDNSGGLDGGLDILGRRNDIKIPSFTGMKNRSNYMLDRLYRRSWQH